MNQDFALNRRRKDPNIGIATLYSLTGKRFVIDYNGFEQLFRKPEYFVTTLFFHFKNDNLKIELEWIDNRPVLYSLLDRYIPNVVSDYVKLHHPTYSPGDESGKDWTCLVMIRKISKAEKLALESEGVEFSDTELLDGETNEYWRFDYGEPKTFEECEIWNSIPDLSWLVRANNTKDKKRK